jgi:hypothetical protein
MHEVGLCEGVFSVTPRAGTELLSGDELIVDEVELADGALRRNPQLAGTSKHEEL